MKVWVKSLIGTILALLGFHSCDPSTVIEEPEMYGPGPDKWEDMTAEQLSAASGLTFGVPEGAENVIYLR